MTWWSSRHSRNRAIVLRYLLARLENMSSIGDPAIDHLPVVRASLGLDEMDLRSAQKVLRESLPPSAARSVERLLTGDEWADDGGQAVGNRIGAL